MQVAWLSLLRSLPGVDCKEFSSKGLVVSRGWLNWICRWEIFREELFCSSRVCSCRGLLNYLPGLSLVGGGA